MSPRHALRLLLVCFALAPWRAGAGEPTQDDKARPRTDLYGDPLPDGALARVGTERLHHGGIVGAVAFSPDGKTLAAVGGDAVRLWDPAAGRELRHYDGAPVFGRCCWFPDGRGLWLQTFDGAIYSWDLRREDRGPAPAPFKGEHTGFIAASPDGKTLAAGSKNAIRLWDVATGQEIRTLEAHKDEVQAAAYSADGKVLASQSAGDLYVWDPATGEKKSRVPAAGGAAAGRNCWRKPTSRSRPPRRCASSGRSRCWSPSAARKPGK